MLKAVNAAGAGTASNAVSVSPFTTPVVTTSAASSIDTTFATANGNPAATQFAIQDSVNKMLTMAVGQV